MSLAIRAKFEPARSLGFALIGAAYMGIGTAFTHPVRMLIVTNRTDVDLWFSFNGIDDQFIITANTAQILDVSSNKTAVTSELYFAEGERLYVKEVSGAPTMGNVYVSTIYGVEI